MANTGILTIDELRQVKYASAVKFGLDNINQVLSSDLAQYNGMVQEQMGYLAVSTTDQAKVWGSSASVGFIEMDEFGTPISKKNVVGSTVMFPIRVWGAALGWTEKFLQLHTPAELIERYDQIKRGHAENMLARIQKALFNNVNFDQVDPFTGVTLNVKRLINADSSLIPQFGGTSFNGATHTHYLARTSTLANADIDGAISTVTEHGMTKGVKIFVNSANIAAVMALSKAKALDSSLMAYAGVSSTIAKLDMSDTSNYLAGYWAGLYEIHVKPSQMIPSGYILVCATEEVEKPLAFRQLAQSELQGLRIDAPMASHPLVAQNMEAIFDFGVFNRLSASVLYVGNTTWANPS